MKRSCLTLTIFLMAAVLSSCASLSEPKVEKINLVYTGTPESKIDPKTFWVDSELKKTFEKYWAIRYTKDMSKQSFLMEAPHFQEMVDEQRYNVYTGNAWQNKPVEIRLQRITKDTDSLYTIVVDFYIRMANGESSNVSFADQWIKVREKWYHLIKDTLFFPAAS